jgi:hypothetical protein
MRWGDQLACRGRVDQASVGEQQEMPDFFVAEKTKSEKRLRGSAALTRQGTVGREERWRHAANNGGAAAAARAHRSLRRCITPSKPLCLPRQLSAGAHERVTGPLRTGRARKRVVHAVVVVFPAVVFCRGPTPTFFATPPPHTPMSAREVSRERRQRGASTRSIGVKGDLL